MPTTTVPVLSYQDLVQLSAEREQHIAEIKNEVSQEVDNLAAPQPISQALATN